MQWSFSTVALQSCTLSITSRSATFHFSGCLEAVCNLRLGAIWEGRGWNVIPVHSLTQFQHSFWNRAAYWIFLRAWCVIFSYAGGKPDIVHETRMVDGNVCFFSLWMWLALTTPSPSFLSKRSIVTLQPPAVAQRVAGQYRCKSALMSPFLTIRPYPHWTSERYSCAD